MDEKKAAPRLSFEEERPAFKLRFTRMDEGEKPDAAADLSAASHRAQQRAAIRKGYAQNGAMDSPTETSPSRLHFEEDRQEPATALRHESPAPNDADAAHENAAPNHGVLLHEDDAMEDAAVHELDANLDTVSDAIPSGQDAARARSRRRPHIHNGEVRSGKRVEKHVDNRVDTTAASSPKLRFENNRPERPSVLRHSPMSALKNSAKDTLHERFDAQRDDNSAVTAAHEGEKALESGVRTISNVRSRLQQRKAIRQGYAAAKSGIAPTTSTARATSQAVFTPMEKAGQKVEAFLQNRRGVAVGLVLILMLMFIMNSVSACAPLIQAGIQAAIIGTYPAEEADVLAAERVYHEKELALQDELDHYSTYHPGYDEVQINQMRIWHDPYALMALICATVGDSWTIDDAYPIIDRLFTAQYELTETTETVDGHTICRVKLTNKNLSYLPFHVLSHEQVGLYALYMATLGNMPDLFASNPDASRLKDPMLYDVPEEYLAADPDFAKLIEEAEKYLGYPYVWGGSEPYTSFDCSGFISWIFTETGVRNIGRLGATGLYGACSPVEPENARPGDLIFFTGTLGDGVDGNDGITHVGLYVGDGMMIHCGNPISYADLSEPYWPQHFYGFGRL